MSWKEAASLILMALKEKPYTSMYNYQLLMLKRSDKSSFMPSGYVFPGGTVESADSSSRWLNLFKKFSISTSHIAPITDLPPIFQSGSGCCLKDLTLRITAIRETFEETGVLLCRKTPYKGELWSCAVSEDVEIWRQKVQNDPAQFLELCETFNCVPDVYSLKLWSNWLTPPDFKKRFDTVFYTACLPVEPRSSADMTEIQHLKWCSPEKLYQASELSELWLPPPQFYELSRLLLFHMLENLADFAGEREGKGCFQFGGQRLITKDGMIFPGPGDDLHDVTDTNQFANDTFEELRNHSKRLHRLEIRKNGSVSVVVSGVKPTHGHILPRTTLKNPQQHSKI